MANQHTDNPAPSWWTAPGETDTFSYISLVVILLLVLLVIHLYARFDRFAEHHSADTPLRTTVPTMLMIALAFEVFPPLSHFSILLPLALIAAALGRDYMLWSHGSGALTQNQAPPAASVEDPGAEAPPDAGGRQRAVFPTDPGVAPRPDRPIGGKDDNA
ncbi:hypothetical protein [Sedimentitalea nanhaiensis]|uniref:Uncharacterized protein n=1 Tax=Sedimentitalea nanhaiensis TaxID=999627 RepID=A0A1I7E951_9RHOB|nr:hypothetical protein [Sedimentitalea nanhaiensis]SFU20415.1 hypothetical protein SAMN05216236_15121 [Sedimentitalea nanhaiensis]